MSESERPEANPEPAAPEALIGGPPSDELVEVFRSGSGPNNYVAAPAPGYDVHGFWHCFGATGRTGYATHAVALHWALDCVLGVPTQLIPHRFHDIDIDQFPSDRYEMLFDWTKRAVGHPHLLVCSYPPDVAATMSELGPPLIPYCAFESTKVSRYVADLCNNHSFREVWVVSPFVRRAFVDSGVSEDRVHVVEPGLWGGPWASCGYSEDQLLAGSCSTVTLDNPFTFGAMGTWHARKGFHRLVEAYWRAFRRDDPVQLVIRTSVFGKGKTIREFKEQITAEMREIAAALGDDGFPSSKRQPRVRLLLGTDATDQEIIDWLGTLDCYANATFGEGLGIPHIWAKCQGVPMVSSAYGAVGEMLSSFCEQGSEDVVFPSELVTVDAEMPKISMMFERDSQWGDYDIDDLISAMQRQFEVGRRIDMNGAMAARGRFDFDLMAYEVRERLRANVDAQVLADLGVR